MASEDVTDREREVLALVSAHLTNAEIAGRLFLSVRTVESHVSSLIRKLEVPDRRSLARRAEELGMLRQGPLRSWPRPASGFVGRAHEDAVLSGLIGKHRLLTVTGPGGVGKTRLTLHTVEHVAAERADGAWFVDLSQIAEAAAVLPAVAEVMGVVDRPGQPLLRGVQDHVATADAVLVLDNCEHLLHDVAALVAQLIGASESLTVVATSRAPLRTPEEWVYELAPLESADAVELFRARAAAAGGVVPDDPRVEQLCADLERMALAIELAAARYPGLGLDGLAAALGEPLQLLGSEHEGRRRSLRAAIAWSVDLLDDTARELLAGLWVFAAPFTAVAAQAVAGPERRLADTARVLATLADHHLLYVQPGNPTRYRFQEVVRQFAAELQAEQASAVHERHAAWVSEELAALSTAESDQGWLSAFDNVAVEARAALAHGVGRRELGEVFAEQLLRRGRLEESQHVFEATAAQHARKSADRAALLRLAAGAAATRLVGDEVLRLLDASTDAASSMGDVDAAADALAWSVIFAAYHPGIMANAPEDSEIDRRLAAAEALSPSSARSRATLLAARAMRTADETAADHLAREAVQLAISADAPVLASAALDCVCSVQISRGEYGEALTSVRARGELMDPLPLSAATGYPFNDYLLMGCEVSLAAGDLLGARAYAERLTALPCYRDYTHPALARRVQVDALIGDVDAAVSHGAKFYKSWDSAGRHSAATLGVGAYAVAFAHALLGDDEERARWQLVARHLLGDQDPAAFPVGWAPTLDALQLLDQGHADQALARVSAPLDDDAWGSSTTWQMWRPWYAATWAEAAALRGVLDAGLAAAREAARPNRVASLLVDRAELVAKGDQPALAVLASGLSDLGAEYQARRTRMLADADQTTH